MEEDCRTLHLKKLQLIQLVNELLKVQFILIELLLEIP